MDIISHRGLWFKPEERNSVGSLKLSLDSNFGLETDIRDWNDNLVISHDMPNEANILLTDLLEHYRIKNSSLPLALNIKADGLHDQLKRILADFSIDNYFLFDMSVPDLIGYVKREMKVFLRLSEYEHDLFLYDKIEGIWLDSFNGLWYDEKLIKNHLDKGKKVCLVSDELHHRPFDKQWELILNWSLNKRDNFILCTDYPEKGKEVFL